jgi:anti-repressor protein
MQERRFMNELVKVDFDTQTVSARELHEQLHIGTKFTTWFERMKEYGFTEGNEFFPKMGETTESGGRPSVDYDISVDMAKQICMIQRTPEGKAVRQYLIDLEKAWNTPEQVMARALKLADQTIDSLKTQVIEMKPKADYFDALIDKKLNTNIRDTAKELGVGERAFVSFLISNRFVFRQGKHRELRPYAQYTESGNGLFVLKDKHNENSGWAGQQMFVTPKGKETFRLLMGKERNE